jgi:two-component system, LytTR family, response regulator LytT
MKMKCLIVEDEPIAQEILKSYIDRTDFLQIEGQFSNALEAFNFLQHHPVDLIFLDIKMPQMTGIDLLKEIGSKPKAIITSAYRYYATDAFELDVVDYLLKPYSFQRFLKAVNKVTSDGINAVEQNNSAAKERTYFFVKGNKQLQKVFIEDILFIESQRDYLKFRMENNQDVSTRQTIGYYEEFLPGQLFLRIHRSFIVAINKISAVEANRVLIKQIPLPIGRNYKKQVLEYLKHLSDEP